MPKRNVEELEVIKKGEASKLLGFGTTAGYKYLDFLCKNKLLLPIRLPGVKTPRYKREEVLALLENRDEIKGIPEFQTN
jgi:hypothetical protein